MNRAVSARAALVLGVDVQEINAWGLDCYTRRNILDGVGLPPAPLLVAL